MPKSCCGDDVFSGDYDMMDGRECCISEEEVHIRDCFRLLWVQHVYWTRMVIISIAMDLSDLEPTTNRLLRNVPDFARLFAHFYGKRVADEFSPLLKDHLVIAADLVKAAKAGDTKAAAALEKRWYENADEIVCFLNDINPCWTIERMRAMWFKHLELTKAEAVARLNKDYVKDIKIFNRVEKEAMIMADDFSRGIVRQFGL